MICKFSAHHSSKAFVFSTYDINAKYKHFIRKIYNLIKPDNLDLNRIRVLKLPWHHNARFNSSLTPKIRASRFKVSHGRNCLTLSTSATQKDDMSICGFWIEKKIAYLVWCSCSNHFTLFYQCFILNFLLQGFLNHLSQIRINIYIYLLSFKTTHITPVLISNLEQEIKKNLECKIRKEESI